MGLKQSRQTDRQTPSPQGCGALACFQQTVSGPRCVGTEKHGGRRRQQFQNKHQERQLYKGVVSTDHSAVVQSDFFMYFLLSADRRYSPVFRDGDVKYEAVFHSTHNLTSFLLF